MGFFFSFCSVAMKFNIADPHTGAQKLFEIDDDKRLRFVLDKRISHEVNGAIIGDQFQDYTFKITGGADKQGFPMKQGILVPDRVRLLLNENSGGYRMARTGERKRRSVRGCIVSRDISVCNMIIAKRGKEPIPDLTNKILPRRLGPKRANNIRKLFNLDKSDDVRYVVRREIPSKKEGGKPKSKAPKIQRLITPEKLQRKRRRASMIRKQREHSKQQAAAYAALLAQRQKEKRAALLSKKSRASQRKSEKKQ